MKAIDIIERVDLLEPNDYSPEQKLHWLSSLDGKIFREVIKTHEGAVADPARSNIPAARRSFWSASPTARTCITTICRR